MEESGVFIARINVTVEITDENDSNFENVSKVISVDFPIVEGYSNDKQMEIMMELISLWAEENGIPETAKITVISLVLDSGDSNEG